MTTIEKNIIIYKAFDGKEFTTEKECLEYEEKTARSHVVNLLNFDIEFPMQDSWSYCTAYRVNSENEFAMLKAFILAEYYDTDPDYIEYSGNGWYVMQGGDSTYANLYKLSNIMKAWNNTLELIIKKAIDFN